MSTIILGLDGSSFELIDRWLENGDLPNLARLREEGVGVDMESCLPPVTCPNWKCYATGKNPGQLGVFWWEGLDREKRKIEITSSASQFDGTDYWSYMDGPVAIVNLPTSYPPPEVDGVHIAGGPGSESSGYTYPASLQGDLERRYDYRIFPEHMSQLNKNNPESDCVAEILDLIDMRFEVARDLAQSDDYEFVHVTTYYLNVLQHFFWDDDVTKRAYERIDERVGELLDAEELDHVFVMSDHGSNEVHTTFRINSWLERNGYLVTKSGGISDMLHKAGLTAETISPLLDKLGIWWWANQLVPSRIKSMVPDEEGSVDKTAKANVIDWDKSMAFASGQGPLYVLADDPVTRRQIRDELVEKLDGLTDDEGRVVVRAALPADQVYHGPYVDDGPDILLDQGPGVHIEGRIGSDTVFDEPGRWSGENKTTGLFMAHGDTIDPTATLANMRITDIAPTVLHLHGYPVPSDMDGTVRTELFREGSDPATRDVETVSAAEVGESERTPDVVDEGVGERLQNLGYLN